MNELIKSMKSLRCLKPKERKKIRSLYYIFQGIDRQIQRFKRITGMDCLKGCGHCCEVSTIEVTVLEMIPFALHAWAQGQADFWLDELQQRDHNVRCVFYEKEIGLKQGHCRIYPLRPLLCRLFGFSVNMDKYKQRRLVYCELINKNASSQVKGAHDFVRRRNTLVTMRDFAMQVWNVDPLLSRKLVPINEAAKQALEIMGLKLKYVAKEVKPRTRIPMPILSPGVSRCSKKINAEAAMPVTLKFLEKQTRIG